METQTVDKKENKCSEWQLCLFLRISTASGRPKREFKPKSIRSSIETLDNNQHNGLTHSSSIRSTGTALSHTPSPSSSRLCFYFLFFAPTFPVIVIHYLFCCSSQISRSTTQLMAKVGICSWSSECCRDLPPVYLLFMSLHVQYILIGNNMSSVTYTVYVCILYVIQYSFIFIKNMA